MSPISKKYQYFARTHNNRFLTIRNIFTQMRDVSLIFQILIKFPLSPRKYLNNTNKYNYSILSKIRNKVIAHSNDKEHY